MAIFKQGDGKIPPAGAGFSKNQPLTDPASAKKTDPRALAIIDAFEHPDPKRRGLSLSKAADKAKEAIDSGLEISSFSEFLSKALSNTKEKDTRTYALEIIRHAAYMEKDIGCCYPLLINALANPDPMISSRANELLENAMKKGADLSKHMKMLEGFLSGNGSAIQRKAFFLLEKMAGAKPNDHKLMTIIGKAVYHPDVMIRGHASRSLDTIIGSGYDINSVSPDINSVRNELETALQDRDPGIRRSAMGLLRSAIEKTPKNVAIMKAVANSLTDADTSLNASAARILTDIADKGFDISPILPNLETAYRDRNEMMRRNAFSILKSAYSKHPENVRLLVIISTQFKSMISDAQMATTRFLENAAEDGHDLAPVKDVLESALSSLDTRVRRSAFSILKKSHDKNPDDSSTLILIAKGLQDPTQEIQTSVVRYLENKAMAGADFSSILDIFDSTLSHKDKRVRLSALQILKPASEKHADDDRYLKLIGKGLRDPDPDLQDYALRCIERAANSNSDISFCVEPLAALINSPDDRISRQALGLLSTAAEHGTDISLVIDTIISCLESADNIKRNRAVKALSGLADNKVDISKAFPLLGKVLESKDSPASTRHNVLNAFWKAAENGADAGAYVDTIASALYDEIPELRLTTAYALKAISRKADSETNLKIIQVFLDYSNSRILMEEAEKNSVFYVEFIGICASLLKRADIVERTGVAP